MVAPCEGCNRRGPGPWAVDAIANAAVFAAADAPGADAAVLGQPAGRTRRLHRGCVLQGPSFRCQRKGRVDDGEDGSGDAYGHLYGGVWLEGWGGDRDATRTRRFVQRVERGSRHCATQSERKKYDREWSGVEKLLILDHTPCIPDQRGFAVRWGGCGGMRR